FLLIFFPKFAARKVNSFPILILMMNLQDRLQALIQLGDFLRSDYAQAELEPIFRRAEASNGWFSPEQSKFAIHQLATNFLDKTTLQNWAAAYLLPELQSPQKKVGLVLAGNIPA